MVLDAPGVVLVVAGVEQLRRLGECGPVAGQDVLADGRKADAAERRGTAGEAGVDDLRAEANGVEDLRPPVGIRGGDAHLREDLEDALLHGVPEAHQCLGHRDVLAEAALGHQLGDRRQHQRRAHRLGPVAEQAGEVMDLPGLVGLDHDRHPGPLAGPQQPLMGGSHRQEHRDRGAACGDVPVRDHEDAAAETGRMLGLVGKAVQPGSQAVGTVGDGEGGIEPVAARRLEQQEGLQLEERRPLRPLPQHRVVRADQGPDAHHAPLPDGVHRRVGHLGETLLEVVVDRPLVIRQAAGRGVVPHGGRRLVARGRHRADHGREVLVRVPEHHLPAQQVRGDLGVGITERGGVQESLDPLPVRPGLGEAVPDGVLLEAPIGGVDADHLAGTELAAAYHAVATGVDRPCFGGTRDHAVLADEVAHGPESVAVEGGAHPDAVGEDHPGRSVPRLHQAGVVAVEVPHVVADVGERLPRGGDQHRHRVAHVPALSGEELEHVVEHGGVRAGGVDDGTQQFLLEQVDLAEAAFPGPHPVDVALDGVDLAVVAEHPERLRPLPGRQCVGREPLVEDRQRHLVALVGEVEVEVRQFVGQAHALVGDGAERERREVDPDPRLGAGLLGPLAGADTAALGLGSVQADGLQEQGLLDDRLGGLGAVAEGLVIDGHLPPPDDLDALPAAGFLDDASVAVVPDERHGHADE